MLHHLFGILSSISRYLVDHCGVRFSFLESNAEGLTGGSVLESIKEFKDRASSLTESRW